jgi:type III restriction enzyme
MPEYVNVFGVPLSIYEPGEGGEAPPPPKPSTQIEALPERKSLEIRWPNVVRVESKVSATLSVDWTAVEAIHLDPAATAISAELAPALGGATDLTKVQHIDLEKLPEEFRLQRLVFRAAKKVFTDLRNQFQGANDALVLQVVRLVETFLSTDKVHIPSLFHSDPVRRNILIALNLDLIVSHILQFVKQQNVEELCPVYDSDRPIGGTGDMRAWYTTRPNLVTIKSQISHVVGDAGWEGYAAGVFERRNDVAAYAKNDHLGFQIVHMWLGSRRKFTPDFLIRLANGRTLVLEIKGRDSPQDKAKREALAEWIAAINSDKGFGEWSHAVAFSPNEIDDIVHRHAAA